MKKNVVLFLSGGLGNQIMRNFLVRELKQKYEKVYVYSPYQDAYAFLKDVILLPNNLSSSVIQQLLFKKNTVIINENPYNVSDFIQKRIHFFDAVRSVYGLKRVGQKQCMQEHAIIDLPTEQKQQVSNIVNQLLQENNKQELILIQQSGGQSPLDDVSKNKYSFDQGGLKRAYPYMQEVVKLLQEKHPNALFLQYRLANEPAIEGTVAINVPYILYNEIAKYCKFAVCIDSSLQHIIAGNTKTNVLWIETSPEHFGYSFNNNIIAVNNKKDVDVCEPYFTLINNPPVIIDYKSAQEIVEEIEND